MRRHTHSFAIKIDFISLYCFRILSTLAFAIDLRDREKERSMYAVRVEMKSIQKWYDDNLHKFNG